MISTTAILSCSAMVSITIIVLRIKLCIEYNIPQQLTNLWDRSQYYVLPSNMKDTEKYDTKSYKIRKGLSALLSGATSCMKWLLNINIHIWGVEEDWK